MFYFRNIPTISDQICSWFSGAFWNKCHDVYSKEYIPSSFLCDICRVRVSLPLSIPAVVGEIYLVQKWILFPVIIFGNVGKIMGNFWLIFGLFLWFSGNPWCLDESISRMILCSISPIACESIWNAYSGLLGVCCVCLSNAAFSGSELPIQTSGTFWP